MAELHDEALHDEHAATDRDHEAKAIAERLEDERKELQAFADWMNEQHHYGGAIAEICEGTAYVEIIYSGSIGFINGKIQFPIRSRTLWKCLWAIYQKENAAQNG